MRRSVVIATAVVATLPLLALAGTSWAAGPGAPTGGPAGSGGPAGTNLSHPPAPAPAQCRAGTVHPIAELTVSGNVCVRYSSGKWVGSGSVTLTATRPVSGNMSWGPRDYPSRPDLYVGFKDFTVQPGKPLVVPLDGTSTADPADTGAQWEVWVGVANGNRAIPHSGQLASPVAARTSRSSVPGRWYGTTDWSCSVRPVSGFGLSGKARLCVRQVKGTVETKGSLTYTSRLAQDVYVGSGLAGQVGSAQITVTVPAARRARTVALPGVTSQVLKGDRTATAFVQLTDKPVVSAPLAVR